LAPWSGANRIPRVVGARQAGLALLTAGWHLVARGAGALAVHEGVAELAADLSEGSARVAQRAGIAAAEVFGTAEI
jgi:hypothetical protein